MRSYILLKAIGEIDDRYILSAQEKLGLSPAVPVRRSFRRALVALIAALITLFSTVTVAMAVSDDFREAVFDFLGIGQTVVVPEYVPAAPGGMEVEDTGFRYGGLLEGTYVHTPLASVGRNGIFRLCTDDEMMKSGNRFDAYAEENGELIPLEKQLFSRDYTILGRDFHLEFEWVAHDGIYSLTYMDEEASAPCIIRSMAGPPEAVLMEVCCRVGEDWTNYPVLVDLYTGELTDILAGTGAEPLPRIFQSAISRDRSKLLLITKPDEVNESLDEIYYADLSAKKLYSVTELSGEHPDACAFAGGALACWVLEGEDVESRNLGAYRIWNIDLETFQRRDLFASIPATGATSYDTWSALCEPTYRVEADKSVTPLYPDGRGGYTETRPELPAEGLHFLGGFDRMSHYGNMYAGSCFALEVDAARNVWVLDLETGERSPIRGFTWPDIPFPGIECQPSPDGRKLLIYSDRISDGCITSVGVLDFDKKAYLEFDRENPNDVSECSITWFDHDRIVIGTSPKLDGPPDRLNIRDYYIYTLLNN